MREFITPMMRQFAEIKAQYPDCLIFFRLGDFYELFMDDATLGAKVLGITLTQRPSGKDGHIPMAGVPYHASDAYLAKLVKAGHKVAICEQMTPPGQKGLVKRSVVRIVTPGTVLDDKTLDQNQHNYVMSFSRVDDQIGLAFADISTGDLQVTEFAADDQWEMLVRNELAKFQPVECIMSDEAYGDTQTLRVFQTQPGLNIYPFPQWSRLADTAEVVLQRHFQVRTLRSFGLTDHIAAQQAAASLLGYLEHTQQQAVKHMRNLKWYTTSDHLNLDQATIINLELFATIRERESVGSLLHLVDSTVTAMGGRLLRSWLSQPLIKRHRIKARLDAVEELFVNTGLRSELQTELKQLYDLERILARLTVGLGNPVEVVNLKLSLQAIIKIRSLLQTVNSALLMNIAEQVEPALGELAQLIQAQISDDPPLHVKHGQVIKNGIDSELDELRQLISTSKQWLAQLEVTEREQTGIGSLKVRFNQVFGYYIEISKANLHLVPAHYQRKQSMVNAERFYTPALKEYEEKILVAEEQLLAREQALFQELVIKILEQTTILQQAAAQMATLDCLISFAHTAQHQRYVKPRLTEAGTIDIKGGRHPMVEQVLGLEHFVPNNTLLNSTDHQLLVLTGPNMAGKSVYMRQVALIVVMAQVGMFVPAQEATISVVDRLFVRSGAADAITSGLSTFMVEMVETAHILRQATANSLIILDEIGRGTSTYDGLSIAWAVAEYLVTTPELAAKTLFATHYHELQVLEEKHPERVKNYQMMVLEQAGEPVFLHQVASGRASHSYAVAVAKLAGLPQSVTTRALTILRDLEHHGQH